MALAVKLPKLVAIQNYRLALTHYFMLFCLTAGLIGWKFFINDDQYAAVSITTNLQVEWKETESIQAMDNFEDDFPEVNTECQEALEIQHPNRVRWGFEWVQKQQCSNFCKLDATLTHYYWPREIGPANGTVCLSEFKEFGINASYTPLQFMEYWGKHDVILSTSKQDWIVDHNDRQRVNYIEVVPQGLSAIISFTYSYQYDNKPPHFPIISQQHKVDPRGDNFGATTIILDYKGHPVSTYQPGEAIDLTVRDILTLLGQTEELKISPDLLIQGREITMQANCFGKNSDLNAYLFGLGDGLGTSDAPGSLDQPVCTIFFNIVGNQYNVATRYNSVRAPNPTEAPMEVVSETHGLLFRAEPGLMGRAKVLDLSLLLLNITSMLVLMSLPQKVTFVIAARFLGPLSKMYRRCIIEPYDIEETAASSATVLASNLHCYHTLKTVGEDDGQDRGVIKMGTIKAIMREAFESRKHVLSPEEISALSHFLYGSMHKKKILKPTDSCLDDAGLPTPACCAKKGVDMADPEAIAERARGITIDQWNQCRMESEKITFEAVAELFDTDRRRFFLEQFYTPKGIRRALNEAMSANNESSGITGQASGYTGQDTGSLGGLFKSMGLADDDDETPLAASDAGETPLGNPFAGKMRRPSAQTRISRENSARTPGGRNDLRSELDAVVARLALLEDKSLQEASVGGCNTRLPVASRRPDRIDEDEQICIQSSCNYPSEDDLEFHHGANSRIEAQAHREIDGSVSAVSSDLSEMEKRLANVEEFMKKVADREVRPRGSSSAASVRSAKSATERAWAEAILNSLGPDALPESEGSSRKRHRSRATRPPVQPENGDINKYGM